MPYGICYIDLVFLTEQPYHFKEDVRDRQPMNPRRFVEGVELLRCLQGPLLKLRLRTPQSKPGLCVLVFDGG